MMTGAWKRTLRSAALLGFVAALTVAGGARGETPAAPDTARLRGPTPRLPAIGAVDTVRTNLWLARALVADILAEGVRALPPAPGAVVVRPLTRSPANTLLLSAAQDLLAARGDQIFLDERDVADKTKAAPAPKAPAGATELRFSCEDLSLAYPAAGRRFGLWRQWVGRELSAAVVVTIIDRDTGRLLYDERLVRVYDDRVPAERFAGVRSGAYAFTDAPVPEGGWRRHAEEAVVLGSLIGLVALYFANTSN
jgi:hypothetical protein